VAAPVRRIAPGQFAQLLCDVTLDLDLVWSRRLRPVVQGGFQPFRHEALPQALNRSRAGPQSRDDLGLHIRLTKPLIRPKQNARMGQLPGCCFAYGNQLFQLKPFLHRERHPLLVHRGTPCLEAQPAAKAPRNSMPRDPSIEDEWNTSTLSRSNLWVEGLESHGIPTLSTHKIKRDEVLGASGVRRCRLLPMLLSVGRDWPRATTAPVAPTLLGARQSSARARRS
jgi:hypothetical protein